ncbi:DegT/DnrJ/EryC1/StrS family aminotransferase [Candidatus Pacearchaeota archaeon]|nr:DegT/DnrJ/EryC1/StrS family aminotransferase [Candidatus Pacearchaeota archaeon]
MEIPIARPFIGEEEKRAVLKVLESGRLFQGKVVKEFEEAFARFCKVQHAILVSSGTSALIAALYACGLKEGDEVITTPFTFIATANAIMYFKAKPVFVDIGEDFNIDPSKIEEKITKRTRAILPVDLYGLQYDYDAIKRIADKHKLFLIEDACQAVGAEYQGRKAGTLGDLAAFSLQESKNIMSGEGGIITTNNPEYAGKIRDFINIGQRTKYDYVGYGLNFRITEMQAAIALEQLKRIEVLTKKRIENAHYFLKELAGLPNVILPSEKGTKHVFHQFTLRITNGKRDLILQKLGEKGIAARVYYPQPLHLTTLYKGYSAEGSLPVAEQLAKEVISIPVHPQLTREEREYIVKSLRELLA